MRREGPLRGQRGMYRWHARPVIDLVVDLLPNCIVSVFNLFMCLKVICYLVYISPVNHTWQWCEFIHVWCWNMLPDETDFHRYATSYLVQRQSGVGFEALYEAGRRGRTGEDCRTLFMDCNAVWAHLSSRRSVKRGLDSAKLWNLRRRYINQTKVS